MDDQPKALPIPVRAWFAMAVLMMLMGFVLIHMAVNDFHNDVAHAKSHRLLTRAEHPYGFWIYNGIHLCGGVFGLSFSLFCYRGGRRQMQASAPMPNPDKEGK